MPLSYDIFISSPPGDRAWVKHVVSALAKEGVSAWDDTQVKPGAVWADEVLNAIEVSRHVLFIFTNSQLNKNWRALELGLALGAGKPVIPLIPKNMPPEEIPGPLRIRQYLQKDEPEVVAKEIKRVLQPQEGDSMRE